MGSVPDGDPDWLRDAIAVSDDDTQPDADDDGHDDADADALDDGATLVVTLTEELALALVDAAGLADADAATDTDGEHDATGSVNGLPTAEPASTVHAFAPCVLFDPTPSNTTVPRASSTRNDVAGTAPWPLSHAHPFDSDEPLPGVSEHAAAAAPPLAWSHSTGSPAGDDDASETVNHRRVSAGRPMMPAMSTDTTL